MTYLLVGIVVTALSFSGGTLFGIWWVYDRAYEEGRASARFEAYAARVGLTS